MTYTSNKRKEKSNLYTKQLKAYVSYLIGEERSDNTIAKYKRDIQAFFTHMAEAPLNKAAVLNWKEALVKTHALSSVNSMLAAVNGFLSWKGVPQYKVKPLKIQRHIYTDPKKDLSESEYRRLVKAAQKKKDNRLALLIQTICATGIRVSELQYITVEAAKNGQTQVSSKGKNRTVFIPRALCVSLSRFSKKMGIKSGIVFCTKSGTPMDRSNIWKAMKALCQSAKVSPEKTFPHNLRHLFAKTYYRMAKDIARLADLLGHSSINTTRIYTMETGLEHAKELDRMGLASFGT